MVIGAHRASSRRTDGDNTPPNGNNTPADGKSSSQELKGYLKIGDIAGESQDKGHEKWINLGTVAFGIERTIDSNATGAARHRGTTKLRELSCTKQLDASTPKVQEAVADGKNFPKVQLHLCTSSEGGKRVPYLQWELTNARICNYIFGGCAYDAVETITFNYEEIKLIYDKLGKDNKSKGKVEFNWKLEEGTA